VASCHHIFAGQYSLGINEIVRGNSENFRDLIDSLLSDMAKLLGKIMILIVFL
jgi:phage-related minor tail protein